MIKIVVARLVATVPILLGVSIVTFSLMRLVPGDITLTLLGPFATDEDRMALSRELGLDQPVYTQYYIWLSRVLRADFGTAISYRVPVSVLLAARVGNTLVLTAASAFLAIVLGFVGGMLAAVTRHSIYDRTTTLFALVAASAPSFWFGILLLYVFSLKLRWFPAFGMYSIGREGELLNLLWHIPLPAFTACLISLAVIFRLTRSGLIDVLQQDYIRAARARGMSEIRIVGRHAVRSIVPSIVNISGLQVGFIFGSALFAEVIFQWPGLGLLMYNAILARDVPVIQAVLLVIAVVFVIVNLISDITTAALNPQSR